MLILLYPVEDQSNFGIAEKKGSYLRNGCPTNTFSFDKIKLGEGTIRYETVQAEFISNKINDQQELKIRKKAVN